VDGAGSSDGVSDLCDAAKGKGVTTPWLGGEFSISDRSKYEMSDCDRLMQIEATNLAKITS
jgi:hypothetical protein